MGATTTRTRRGKKRRLPIQPDVILYSRLDAVEHNRIFAFVLALMPGHLGASRATRDAYDKSSHRARTVVQSLEHRFRLFPMFRATTPLSSAHEARCILSLSDGLQLTVLRDGFPKSLACVRNQFPPDFERTAEQSALEKSQCLLRRTLRT